MKKYALCLLASSFFLNASAMETPLSRLESEFPKTVCDKIDPNSAESWEENFETHNLCYISRAYQDIQRKLVEVDSSLKHWSRFRSIEESVDPNVVKIREGVEAATRYKTWNKLFYRSWSSASGIWNEGEYFKSLEELRGSDTISAWLALLK
jgi:hypothetical protein